MEMGDDDGAAVEAHKSRPPRMPLAEIEFAGHAPDRAGGDDAAAFHVAPFQSAGETVPADLARRILHRAAIAADLQHEPPLRSPNREPQRRPAARRRQGGWRADGEERVALFRRGGHALLSPFLRGGVGGGALRTGPATIFQRAEAARAPPLTPPLTPPRKGGAGKSRRV